MRFDDLFFFFLGLWSYKSKFSQDFGLIELGPPAQVYTVDWFNLMVFSLKKKYYYDYLIPVPEGFAVLIFRASGEAILGTLKSGS